MKPWLLHRKWSSVHWFSWRKYQSRVHGTMVFDMENASRWCAERYFFKKTNETATISLEK